MKKKSGYRSDLLNEIDGLTSVENRPRLTTKEKLGLKYGLSANTIFRYLRIDNLIPLFKNQLDNRKITIENSRKFIFPGRNQTGDCCGNARRQRRIDA